MKLSSQLTISLFLSSFLLSAFGRASLAEVDPYLPTLKLKCSSTLYSSCKDSQTNPDKNFLLLLTCLEANSHKLDKQCQKEFFLYKFRLYTNPAFLSTLESVCGDEMSNLCEGKRGPKQIECLFKAGHPLVKGKCSSYLGQIGQVMLSDYAVLSDIEGACSTEMDALGCTVGIGKLGVFGSPVIKIAQCLMDNSNKLSANCAKRFSSEGGRTKLEVGIHEECKFDLSKLCGTTQSQTGKKDNFDCLMSQLSEISSPSCLDSLLARGGYYFRKLDIGIDFYQFCSADVKKEQCASSEVMKSDSEGEFTKLTELLFCLGKESVLLSEGCEQEVELLRERFIGEETVSVEFARACETAREKFCSSNYVSVTDCLKDSLEENREAQYKECRGHLKMLTSSRDFSPIRLPPKKPGALPPKPEVTQQNAKPDLEIFCNEELDSLCSTSRSSEYKNSLLCLSHHLSDPMMSQECGYHVGRVMYFADRVIVSASKLDVACKFELKDSCDTEAVGRTACLVSHHATSDTGAEELSAQCAYEVEAFLRGIAASQEMQEDLFSDCLPYLGRLCPLKGSHHTELECLREHQELIDDSSRCFSQLEEFNAVEEKMPSVNANLQQMCHKAILNFCAGISSHALVNCLQKSMSIPGFDPQCKNALTHVNEVSDGEWKLDSKLNKNCNRDLTLHCSHITRVKQAMSCLYPIYRSGQLTKICSAYIEPLYDQDALKVDYKPADNLMLPQAKDSNVASLLETNCAREIQLLCGSIPQEKHLECLIDFKLDVRMLAPCQKAIITEEIDFVVGKHMDDQMMAECKEDIRDFCMFDSSYDVLVCLQSMVKVGAVSSSCKKRLDMVSGPLSKLQLDKNLAIECHSAAYQKCKHRLGSSEKLVNCLSQHMRELEGSETDRKCISEVVVLIGQAQLDIDKDPDLAEKCRYELNTYCANVAMGHGEKIRCLFRLKEDKGKLMGSSCSRALMDREDLWSSLSKRYPNIQRGLEAILDDIEILKQTVYPNIVGILKGIFLLGLLIGIVVICCLCRATRRVRRKIL